MGKPYPGEYFPGATIGADLLDARSSTQSWVIDGRGGNDIIYGGNEPDILVGGGGNDTIYGAPYDTIIDGGPGTDTADFSLYESTDGLGVVARIFGGNLHPNLPDGTPIEPLNSLLNIENLIGSSADDILQGNRRANVIVGGSGDDYIFGFGGGDTLTGDGEGVAEGADTFDFWDARGTSVVTDFDPFEGDRISVLGISNIAVTTEADQTVITYGSARNGGQIILLGFTETWNPTWFEGS